MKLSPQKTKEPYETFITKQDPLKSYLEFKGMLIFLTLFYNAVASLDASQTIAHNCKKTLDDMLRKIKEDRSSDTHHLLKDLYDLLVELNHSNKEALSLLVETIKGQVSLSKGLMSLMSFKDVIAEYFDRAQKNINAHVSNHSSTLFSHSKRSESPGNNDANYRADHEPVSVSLNK